MTLQEARRILEKVTMFLSESEVQIKRLAGEDWCIIIKEGLFYIWNEADWLRYRNILERKYQRKTSSSGTTSTSGDTVDASDRV